MGSCLKRPAGHALPGLLQAWLASTARLQSPLGIVIPANYIPGITSSMTNALVTFSMSTVHTFVKVEVVHETCCVLILLLRGKGTWTVDILGHSIDSRGYPGVDSTGMLFTVMELGAESLAPHLQLAVHIIVLVARSSQSLAHVACRFSRISKT